jgi:hypothetical protein
MSLTNRINRLLAAEDWKKIYQAYTSADYQSYDFDNIRRSMISYLRENYPEDFNDYIESSEYLALIDLIAYVGQSIAFRTDLNARENFIETAERKESVLRLARLISYNPKRNTPATGLLKFDSVTTTETILDSNNRNLKDQVIVWNDPSNANWYEQFIKVLNSALPSTSRFGNPQKTGIINNIPTQQYRFNGNNTGVPVYGFTKQVDGRSVQFEAVSTSITDESILEEAPLPGNNLGFLYRDDGKGPASTSNGFFLRFTQGILEEGTFDITLPTASEQVDIETPNVNNTDYWLYKLNELGLEDELWTAVENITGNNIVYNSLFKDVRNIYTVQTKNDDRVSLIFGDGLFANVPKGSFKFYYRTGNNQRYTITPRDIKGISIDIPYTSVSGVQQRLTVVMSCKTTVDNAATSETLAEIKANAPANFYVQDRMITGEDYNIYPLSISQNIIKTKAVNKISSGISRFYDIKDPTGKYSSTNLYGNDGIIYREEFLDQTSFSYASTTDIRNAITTVVEPIIKDADLRNFYYEKFPQIDLDETQRENWNSVTQALNLTTGYISNDETNETSKVGDFSAGTLKFVEPGALIKFVPDIGYYINIDGTIRQGSATNVNALSNVWAKIERVYGDGTANRTGVRDDGSGPIIINQRIPSNTHIERIIPKFVNKFDDDLKQTMTTLISGNKNFGLRYNVEQRSWKVITDSNLNRVDPFTLANTGDTSNEQLDASWLLLFTTDGDRYTVQYRTLRYVFESDQEIRFFYDSSKRIYDSNTGQVIIDQIKVLNINNQPDGTTPFTQDLSWQVVKEYRSSEGYIDTKKIQISFADADSDGVVDDPDLFNTIVNPTYLSDTKYIFQEKYITEDNIEDFRYIENTNNVFFRIFGQESAAGDLTQYDDGQLFFFTDLQIVKQYDAATNKLNFTSNYKGFVGRPELKFQYIHSASSDARIDLATSNIIEMYILSAEYDRRFRQYLAGATTSKPLPPSSDQLYIDYNNSLKNKKAISDEIVYLPAKYKILFGVEADRQFRAKFKIVKNPEKIISDNDIKSRVVEAINDFFNINNWEFGDTFYYSELATYIMNQTQPDLANIVIVPEQADQTFGSLFEIKAESDEIFISSAKVTDIEVISSITATKIKASGNVVSADTTLTTNAITSGSY